MEWKAEWNEMATLGALWEECPKRKCATLFVPDTPAARRHLVRTWDIIRVGSGKWNELTSMVTHHSMLASCLVRGTQVETFDLACRRSRHPSKSLEWNGWNGAEMEWNGME